MDSDGPESKFELSDTGFPVAEPVQHFALMLRDPNRVRLVNVGPDLVKCVQERLEQLVPVDTFGYVVFKDYQLSFTGRFNVYDIVLDNRYFDSGGGVGPVSKEDMTLIKVVFCRVLGALHCYGYDVLAASDLARDLQTHSTLFFRLRNPRLDFVPQNYYSHKFICVAPYANDSLLLINVPKTAVEDIIKVRHKAKLLSMYKESVLGEMLVQGAQKRSAKNETFKFVPRSGSPILKRKPES